LTCDIAIDMWHNIDLTRGIMLTWHIEFFFNLKKLKIPVTRDVYGSDTLNIQMLLAKGLNWKKINKNLDLIEQKQND